MVLDTWKSSFESWQWLFSYFAYIFIFIFHFDTLLKNATDIITMSGSYFITKCDKSLLQNASTFLLQNPTALLQNATGIKNCDDSITKCRSYYKMRRYTHAWQFFLSKYVSLEWLYYINVAKKQEMLIHNQILKICAFFNVDIEVTCTNVNFYPNCSPHLC